MKAELFDLVHGFDFGFVLHKLVEDISVLTLALGAISTESRSSTCWRRTRRRLRYAFKSRLRASRKLKQRRVGYDWLADGSKGSQCDAVE